MENCMKLSKKILKIDFHFHRWRLALNIESEISRDAKQNIVK